ncbi:MAG: hypothetical protein J5J06_19965 [Phycisphaerae bacterium]|nr:hypothetical protein [Phycisphaerae bacterium]
MKTSPVRIIVLLITLSGCSVVMAARGERPPDLSAIRPGVSKTETELALGTPDSTIQHQHGSTSIYQFETDNEPSPGRAVAHGALDVLTLGIWEAIGTPIELATGENEILVIEFDKDDRIVSVNKSAPKK